MPPIFSSSRQPPPPRAPLFPYTTLFRSQKDNRVAADARIGLFAPGRGVFEELDRKSTRLNSSHRCTSYAVFCLKKKKAAREKCRGRASTASVRACPRQHARRSARSRSTW